MNREQFETEFLEWWVVYREDSDISKKEALAIFETAYRLGGRQPWWNINKEQLKALMKG